jgi:DNA modification methylase
MTVTIFTGDVRAELAKLEPGSIDCVVTSPPYWGLRDYGVEGQIGLERTLGEHLAVMIDVFDLIRPALKPWASVWLNYGDCYATTPNGRSASDTKQAGGDDRTFRDKPFSTIGGALKSGDLCLLPERLAIALQEAGWWVRAKNVWGKPNAMPDSSGRYRPANAHEMVWLLAAQDETCCWRHDNGRWAFGEQPAGDFAWKHRKSGRIIDDHPPMQDKCADWFRFNRWRGFSQYFEAAAVAQPTSGDAHARVTAVAMRPGGDGSHASIDHAQDKTWRKGRRAADKRRRGKGARLDDVLTADPKAQVTRYLRNYERAPLGVWEIPTEGFSEAHFATFPQALAERCILAGCPAGGVVLDPFGGAGTVGLVAEKHNRHATLIELNPDSVAIAMRRIKAAMGQVNADGDSRRSLDPLPLFQEERAP